MAYKPPVVVPLYKFRKYRIEAGLTLELVAQGINLPNAFLASQWERGVKRITEVSWRRFLNLLGREYEPIPPHGLFSAATAPAPPGDAAEILAMELPSVSARKKRLQSEGLTQEEAHRLEAVVSALIEQKQDKLVQLLNKYSSNKALALIAYEAGYLAAIESLKEFKDYL